MDNKNKEDAALKAILQDRTIPEPSAEARKEAINMAMQAYGEEKQKKSQKPSKNFQGFTVISRLIGYTDINKTRTRRKPMNDSTHNKKPIGRHVLYGGMATAMAVVLCVGVTFNMQTSELSLPGSSNLLSSITENVAGKKNATISASQLNAVEFNVDGKSMPSRERSLKMQKAKKETAFGGLAESDSVAMMNMPVPSTPMAAAPLEEQVGQIGRLAQSVIVEKKDLDHAVGDIYQDVGKDKFEDFKINPVKQTSQEPVSTFSVDVDTTSYSFMRGALNRGVLPAVDSVRVEELINYFDYAYPQPDSLDVPFKHTVSVTGSPWAEGNKLIHIGIKGYDIDVTDKPRSNLVFLLDVSGSMNNPNKLPLVKQSMKMLLETLDPQDSVAIVVYAGAAGAVLEPTEVKDKRKIIAALDKLEAGGSTAGGAGIELAYNLAQENFDEDAINRVILATDGDFNVGITNRKELKDFVERKRQTGIFFSAIGFGHGNYNDHLMQILAQNGNGVAAYIDNLNEARKVFVNEATSTLFPIAKDVKIQVEFNPETVAEYRLIGYETRHLNREDFNNDKIDAGDIGAGHTVTAIYEVTPVGGKTLVDPSRYGSAERKEAALETDFSNEYAFLKMRYKLPEQDTSQLITTPIQNDTKVPTLDMETNWATAVAGFGQLLKGGQYTGAYSYDDVIALAQSAKGEDEFGYRAEFIQLVRAAKVAAGMQSRQ